MSVDAILACKSLSVGYDGKIVLSEIDFALEAGTMTVMIGANGSGKSTLLRTLASRQKALSGVVEICGKDINKCTSRELSRSRALVDTSRAGGGGLTVSETVAVGRYAFSGWSGLLTAEDKDMVSKALEQVGMSGFATRHLAELSDGEKQKVMIARALAQETPLILLDEPTAFLDVAARIEVLKLLRSLADEGKTILLSTHDIAPSVARADLLLAVDRNAHTAVLAPKEDMIDSGRLDDTFAGTGLRFDRNILDFR